MKERTMKNSMAAYLVLVLSACCLLFGANLVRCGHLVENGNTPVDKTDTTETSSSSEKGIFGPGSSAYARDEQEDSASGVSASDATSRLAVEEVINIADIFDGDFGEPLVNIPGLTELDAKPTSSASQEFSMPVEFERSVGQDEDDKTGDKGKRAQKGKNVKEEEEEEESDEQAEKKRKMLDLNRNNDQDQAERGVGDKGKSVSVADQLEKFQSQVKEFFEAEKLAQKEMENEAGRPSSGQTGNSPSVDEKTSSKSLKKD